jgi:hypothetical protein
MSSELTFSSLIKDTKTLPETVKLDYEQKSRKFTALLPLEVLQKEEQPIIPDKPRVHTIKEIELEDPDERILLEIAIESRLLDQKMFEYDVLSSHKNILEGKRVDMGLIHNNPLYNEACRKQNAAEYNLLRSYLKQ